MEEYLLYTEATPEGFMVVAETKTGLKFKSGPFSTMEECVSLIEKVRAVSEANKRSLDSSAVN